MTEVLLVLDRFSLVWNDCRCQLVGYNAKGRAFVFFELHHVFLGSKYITFNCDIVFYNNSN